jgi:alanine dehydrogenase
MPLLLTRQDVESVLTMKEAMAAVEHGFRQLALGQVTMPARTAIRLTQEKGLHLGMPAYVAASEGIPAVLALKTVTVFPDNPAAHKLPTTLATLVLHDPTTGALLAVMEAGYLTAMRTGAASGVATRYLAREDAKSLGLFGAGVQARAQLRAIREVRTLDRVIVYDINREAAARFAAEMSETSGPPIEVAPTPQVCLEAAIVVTASSSKTPLFEGSQLRPGTHLNGIGSHSPDARELDTETVRRARIFADHVPSRLAEDADFIIPIREGLFEESRLDTSLGEVIAGLKPGRRSEEEITLFKSGGLAVQDAVTALRVYTLAREAGVGREVQI